jgi:glycosyltransferase involved in cell wall biosynthesis
LGGSESQCNIIANYLVANNTDVLYLAYKGKAKSYTENYKVINSNLSLFSFINILISYKPDIIYWRNNFGRYLTSLIASKFFKCKFVYSVSGPSDIINSHIIIFKYLGRLNFCKFLGSVFNYSNSWINLKGHLFVDLIIFQLEQQKLFNNISKSIIIPNSFEPKILNGFAWPKKYVVWVSNIKSYKNPELFIRLSTLYPTIDFLMVGEIQENKYNEIIRDNLENQSNFYFLGKKSQDEVNSIIINSEFLVHTCEPEGFPNVFLQAWAYGKCTLSLYYDPDNFISNNCLGVYSGDFETLVSDFKSLYFNDKLRAKYETNAFNFYSNFFRTEKVVNNLLFSFKKLVS